MRGKYTVVDDMSLIVDIGQEKVQSRDALTQAVFNGGPLFGGENARHDVVGENFFGGILVTVNSEGHALVQKREIGGSPTVLEFVRAQLVEELLQGSVVWSRLPGGIEHLVVSGIRNITVHESLSTLSMAVEFSFLYRTPGEFNLNS